MNLLVSKVYAQTLNFSSRPKHYNITNVGTLIRAAISVMFILAAIIAFVYLVLGGWYEAFRKLYRIEFKW